MSKKISYILLILVFLISSVACAKKITTKIDEKLAKTEKTVKVTPKKRRKMTPKS